jgi:hypothetical protein
MVVCGQNAWCRGPLDVGRRCRLVRWNRPSNGSDWEWRCLNNDRPYRKTSTVAQFTLFFAHLLFSLDFLNPLYSLTNVPCTLYCICRSPFTMVSIT